MIDSCGQWTRWLLVAVAASADWATPGWAIVVHQDDMPQARPADAVVGRWSSNASFVVVAPNWALTTRHQGTSPGSVVIGGSSYLCAYNTAWEGGPTGNADLRLVRLSRSGGGDANLTCFAPIFAGTEIGCQVVLGGYGKGRGAVLQTGGEIYGYEWAGGSNTVLRWGTNRINRTTFVNTSTYDSYVVVADFDALGEGASTECEAAVAEWDSGGGWFVEDGGAWRLAGLTRAAESHTPPASWFRNRTNPDLPDPDYLDAVRVPAYREWLHATMGYLSIPGDATLDLVVDGADYNVLLSYWGSGAEWCRADFDLNGTVDGSDFNLVLSHWGAEGCSAAPPPPVAEPVTVLTVGTATCVALGYGRCRQGWRRRRDGRE